MKAAFIGNASEIARVFARGRRETIESRTDVLPGVVSPGDPSLRDVEVIFSTWGMPLLTEAELEGMPKLRAVFYAAGAVGHFSAPFIERGVHVSSAWQANGIPVAEFTLSQILLACKGYFANIREYAAGPERGHGCARGAGSYGETVALLGAGAIGAKLVDLLKQFRLEVMVFDPFLTAERAEGLGVRKVSIESAFREAYVISNHLRDTEETQRLIRDELLESMRFGATFINTGRGRTVATDDLVSVLRRRPDITALLDVTDPEPVPPGHPLWALPNVFLSSHIAGSVGDEVHRLADYAIEEFDRFRRGEALRYQVFD
jgi:phosphoglycerate dehydrogenase-like enzyme